MKDQKSPATTSSKRASSGIHIRVEVLAVLLIVLLCLFVAEFPFSPSAVLCPPSGQKNKSEQQQQQQQQPTSSSSEPGSAVETSPMLPGASSSSSSSSSPPACNCDDQSRKKEDGSGSSSRGKNSGATTSTDTETDPPPPPPPVNNKPATSRPISTVDESPSLGAMLELEKEAAFMLQSPVVGASPSKSSTGGAGGGRASSGPSLDAIQKTFLDQLSPFVTDGRVRRAIAEAAASAAKDHRAYAAFSRALRGVAATARLSHVRSSSMFNFADEKSSSKESKDKDAADPSSTKLSSEERKINGTGESSSSSSSSHVSPPRRIELFRYQTSLDDERLTVPFIPTNMKALEVVAPTNFGLVAGFVPPPSFVQQLKKFAPTTAAPSSSSSAEEASSPQPQRRRQSAVSSLRVATLLTGHMRSYRRCAERLRQSVLEPTSSALFIASYPDTGDKRYGLREAVQFDDVVSWNDVQNVYAPHLTGLFVGEVPLLRRRLEVAFPTAFSNLQFSWMLYQFLLIEIGVNLTQAFVNQWDFSPDVVGEMAFGSYSPRQFSSLHHHNKQQTMSPADVSAAVRKNQGQWPWGHFWRDCGGDGGSSEGGASSSCSLVRFANFFDQQQQEAGGSSSNNIRGFDVFIRLRPDLFVIGTIRLSGIILSSSPVAGAPPSSKKHKNNNNNDDNDESSSPSSAPQQPVVEFSEINLELSCGGEARTERNYPTDQWLANFNSKVLLVTPHHPQLEWILDKTSDLSLVATYGTATRYLAMHSYLSKLSKPEQDATFVPLCTAERLWKKRSSQMRLLMNRTFGWFAMLRNASTFVMGRYEGASSERRRKLVRGIFAITNPDRIPCPLANGTMLTMPPNTKKPKGGKKRG